jgi:hypothetical protein
MLADGERNLRSLGAERHAPTATLIDEPSRVGTASPTKLTTLLNAEIRGAAGRALPIGINKDSL